MNSSKKIVLEHPTEIVSQDQMQKALVCKMGQIFNIEQFYSLFSHQDVLQVIEVSMSEEQLSMGRLFLVAGFSNVIETWVLDELFCYL